MCGLVPGIPEFILVLPTPVYAVACPLGAARDDGSDCTGGAFDTYFTCYQYYMLLICLLFFSYSISICLSC